MSSTLAAPLPVDYHAMHQRVSDDLRICPLFRGAEVGCSGAGAAVSVA